jgi:hypothetical protein
MPLNDRNARKLFFFLTSTRRSFNQGIDTS